MVKHFSLGILPEREGKMIQEWRADRCPFYSELPKKDSNKRKLEYNRFRKIELYRYIKKKDRAALETYLNRNFKFEKTMPSRSARFLLKLEGKLTKFKRTKTHSHVQHVPISALTYVWSNDDHYLHHYVRIIKHRKSYYLIRIYEAVLRPTQNVKLEIMYFDDSPKNRGPKDNHLKNMEKLHAIMEIAKRIDAEFLHFPARDHTKHPGGVFLKTLLRRSSKFMSSNQKRALQKERMYQRFIDSFGITWKLES